VNLGYKSATATIAPVTDDGSGTGTFHVILSTPDKDREGEELATGEWETPLPARIPFDVDHEMTVPSTVGSGVPTIEADGNLHVRGAYSALPRAQEVRQLVKEGHIGATSVTYLTKRAPDGSIKRELINGTFTPIPTNPKAVVLEGKGSGAKAAGDARRIQAIHDHAATMGASCTPGKALRGKAKPPVSDKPWSDFTAADYTPAQWHRACIIHDHPAGQVPDDKEHCKLPIREPDGTLNSNGVHAAASVLAGGRGGVQATAQQKAAAARALLSAYHTIGDTPPDSLTALAGKSLRAKASGADGHDGLDAASLAQATDSALDHACDLLADVDLTDLPPLVQEAIALVQAAGASVDELLDAMGLPDPDDMDYDESAAADTDAPDDMSGASKSVAADEELATRKQRLKTLALGALRETYQQQGAQ
jgi:hypothetical protein